MSRFASGRFLGIHEELGSEVIEKGCQVRTRMSEQLIIVYQIVWPFFVSSSWKGKRRTENISFRKVKKRKDRCNQHCSNYRCEIEPRDMLSIE